MQKHVQFSSEVENITLIDNVDLELGEEYDDDLPPYVKDDVRNPVALFFERLVTVAMVLTTLPLLIYGLMIKPSPSVVVTSWFIFLVLETVYSLYEFFVAGNLQACRSFARYTMCFTLSIVMLHTLQYFT